MMRSSIELKIVDTASNKNIDVCVVTPHEFLIEHQARLLPGWQTKVSYLILVLQQSSVSLKKFTPEVAAEKNALRAKFIRMGCTLIFALQDRGCCSDLFDPRTGYPLLASADLPFDDNAAVKTLLNYPLTDYEGCSLITHPTWGSNVYPGTIATVGDRQRIEQCLHQAIAKQAWKIKP